VIKVQCAEHGVTGMREAVVLDGMLGSGRIKLEDFPRGDKSGKVPGWMQDPYGPTIESPLLRNPAEDEQYDAQFPDHPLSRMRSVLRSVQSSLRLPPEIMNAPPFVYGGDRNDNEEQHRKKPWWKVW